VPSDENSSGRRPRADAARNRERLLEAAKAGFTEVGSAVPLEEIARRAGVGIGTLYRHFPTRFDLVEAVYGGAIGQLRDAADQLAETHEPLEALRRWMTLFVDYLATKLLMADALTALRDQNSAVYGQSSTVLRTSINGLVARAAEAGQIRHDVDGYDLLRAIAGLSTNQPESDWQVGARRLINVLIAGLRTKA